VVRNEGQYGEQKYRDGCIEHEAKSQHFGVRPTLDGTLAKGYDDAGEASERHPELGDDRERIGSLHDLLAAV
jgi:hypothetical protein